MKNRAAAALVGIVALPAIALFLTRERPVVYSFQESGVPTGDPSWSLMNPFRDRHPELAAETVLQRLRAGDSTGAFRLVRDLSTENVMELSGREGAYPIRGWTLVGRQDLGTGVRLAYRASRGDSTSADAPVWILVQEVHGNWTPIAFEAWY